MRKTTLLVTALVLMALATPAFALGPVDVEVGASYWLSETTIEAWDESETYDSDELSFWAQIWVKKWGAKGAIYRTSLEDGEFGGILDLDFTSLDVRYKVLSVTENNFLALGLGYESISIDEGDLNTDSTGWRACAEGHVGLGKIVNFYGEAAYFLGMGDFSQEGFDIARDPSGFEIEVGISIKPFPFMNLRAGYRKSALEIDVFDIGKADPSANYEFQPDGFIIGASVNF